MINLLTCDPSNVREVTVPIAMEFLREKFSNAELCFKIDYANSAFKGQKFITYIGNLQLDSDIVITDAVTKEERFELLKCFITTKAVVPVRVLVNAFGAVLCQSKGATEFTHSFETPFLTVEENYEFIEENKELINKYRVLMDSMVVFAMASSTKYVAAFGHPKDSVNNIDLPNEFGSNFVHFFSETLFMEVFYSRPGQEFHFFVKQFEEFMYSSKCLFDYFMVDGNPLVSLFDYIGNNEYTIQQATDDLDYLEETMKAANE